jgi:hypothetical protein
LVTSSGRRLAICLEFAKLLSEVRAWEMTSTTCRCMLSPKSLTDRKKTWLPETWPNLSLN